jgi:predicted ABC-type ATPase
VAKSRGRIFVAAGTNGAGKTSIAGEFLRRVGSAYFDPDAIARSLVSTGHSREEANALAWHLGFEGLRRAVANHDSFAFETTLGGASIAAELHRAINAGLEVCVWYVGLASPELHIERVRARVARGGHDIPEAKIRERYPRSLTNLVSFIGRAAEIHLFDNSTRTASGRPAVERVFRMRGHRIVEPSVDVLLEQVPEWAKPVAAAAIRCHTQRGPARRKK